MVDVKEIVDEKIDTTILKYWWDTIKDISSLYCFGYIFDYFDIFLRYLLTIKDGTVFLTMLNFAIGILCGSFIYVLYDRLLLKFFEKQNITNYPLDIKENRQSVKNFVIPLVMTIMMIFLVYSYINSYLIFLSDNQNIKDIVHKMSQNLMFTLFLSLCGHGSTFSLDI